MHPPAIPAAGVGEVEPVPDLDLHEDAAFRRFPQQALEPLPVFVVPLIEIVPAVFILPERINFEALVLAVAHRIADDVAAGCGQSVELHGEILFRPLEQVVVVAAAQQQYGFSPIAPVPGIPVPGLQPCLRGSGWR